GCAWLEGGRLPLLLSRHETGVSQLALTGDGRVVTTGHAHGDVDCVRLDGTERLRVARHDAGVRRLALTGDGRVMTGGTDGRVYCAQLDSGTPTVACFV